MNCRWWYTLLCISATFSTQLRWLDGKKEQLQVKNNIQAYLNL
ncbi:unnamed protein product [Callosobruchus maculatus]|uniref:Uncharacterized protein n=1 Tax=Callosobruchus maculatus TaxID=64391 RepID=A0A653D0P8_CALMS|nr:unnamed protein product [Callosobruchus maculatus]